MSVRNCIEDEWLLRSGRDWLHEGHRAGDLELLGGRSVSGRLRLHAGTWGHRPVHSAALSITRIASRVTGEGVDQDSINWASSGSIGAFSSPSAAHSAALTKTESRNALPAGGLRESVRFPSTPASGFRTPVHPPATPCEAKRQAAAAHSAAVFRSGRRSWNLERVALFR